MAEVVKLNSSTASHAELDQRALEQDVRAPAPVLDPRDPMAIARDLVANNFCEEGKPTIWRHRGSFWRWGHGWYRALDDETVRTLIWNYLDRAKKANDDGDLRPFKPTRAKVTEVADALASVCVLSNSMDPPLWLQDVGGCPPATEFIALSNGLLHLPTQDLWPLDPMFFATSGSDVAYDPKASEPTNWLKFLSEVFGSDTTSIEMLGEWFGLSLVPDTSQQKILLMVGPPRSGKGTIARIQTALLGGAANVAAPVMDSLSHNFGLEPLIGKPLAIIGDARIGGRANQAAIAERLLSISGEDAHTIDRKFRIPWTGRLTTRFMILTNELPRLTDHSGALARRFIILSLQNSFYGREDPGLTDRLMTELPGILNWAVSGYVRLRNRGHFVQPESAIAAMEELETLSSPIRAFVSDRCEAGGEIEVGELYSKWRQWCETNGHNHGSAQTFGRDLKAAMPGIVQAQPRHGGDRYRVYRGISLKSEWN